MTGKFKLWLQIMWSRIGPLWKVICPSILECVVQWYPEDSKISIKDRIEIFYDLQVATIVSTTVTDFICLLSEIYLGNESTFYCALTDVMQDRIYHGMRLYQILSSMIIFHLI